jgi:hypothetical protein
LARSRAPDWVSDTTPISSAIGRDIVKSLAAGDRGGVDDLAAGALGDHLARGLLHADQAAKPVHAHDEVPVFLGHVEKIHRLVDAGIVELDVQLSEDGPACAIIARTCMRSVTSTADVVTLPRGGLRRRRLACRDLCDLVTIDIGKTDIGAFVQQRFANGAANARAAPVTMQDASRQPSHAASPKVDGKLVWIKGMRARRSSPRRE